MWTLWSQKKDCRVREKINNLNMSEELKDQIAKLLIYDSESETEESEYENEDINNIENNSENESENSCDCNSEICECAFNITMINAETRIALEMIDKLENEGEKLEYLNNY